jgi:hypothetical protein
MTQAEERLRDLLRDAVPEPVKDVRYEDVEALARRRRRARVASATVLALVVAGSAAWALGSARDHRAEVAITPTPTPTATAAPPAGTIAFNGIWLRVPKGWTVGSVPLCGFSPDRTVAVSTGAQLAVPCPMQPPPKVAPRTLLVDDLYGWDRALGWDGTRTTWHGQPAWISTQLYETVTEVQLTLPWLNAAVTATAPDRAAALRLLDSVVPHPDAADLGVPDRADAVEVTSFPAVNASGTLFRTHVTRAADVAVLLADLRSGAPVVGGAAACAPNTSYDSAVLTVRSAESFRTFDAVFGGCQQVAGGTGHAAHVGPQLRQDVVRLAKPVPPDNGRPGCEGGGGGVAPSAVGAPTREAALAQFLASHAGPTGYPQELSSWTEVDAGVYLSGYEQVDVAEIPSPGRGYWVEFASNC